MEFIVNWFEALTFTEQLFACIAIVATVLLLFQFVLLLIGAASHASGDLNGHDIGGHDHDFGHGHDMDVGHDGDFGGAHGDVGHDFGGDVHGDFGHDFGHSFGHGDVGGIHGDVGAHGDFSGGDLLHDGSSALGADADTDFPAHGQADGSFDYDHDMQAGHTHVGTIVHDFADVQGGVVVDVHSGDIYLADAAPHDLMVNGPDVGIPDHDLPDGRTYVDRADKVHGSGFKLFTMQGIIAFFSIYGWTGLLFMKANWHVFPASTVAALCGIVAMFLMSLALWGMLKIQSDGTVNIKNALGQSGEVYIPIPGKRESSGKVMVKVQDQLSEFDAVTDEDEKIATGTQVTVIGITKGTTLIVTKHN
ncbi:MAG: NfeD family protein [Clostridiales bacterium]|nr:NfeD family protein [Clostridiales bacterium]